MAKLSTLFDDFEDGTLNTTLWDDSLNATEGSGYCAITPANTYANRLGTTTTFDFASDSFEFELTFSAGAVAGAEQYCQIFTGNGGETIQMGRFQQSIGYDYNGNSEFVTYSATDHRHCRVRTTATQIFFETSTDGSTWVNPFTTGVRTLAAWSLASVAVQFINAFFSGSGGGDMRVMQVGENSTVAISGAETGTGTETQTIGVSNGSETGTGTETNTIAATLSDGETGPGAETQSIALSSSDTGSGTESESIAQPASDSDVTAAAAESQSLAASLSESETTLGTESHSLAVQISSSDTASGAETEAFGDDTPEDLEGGSGGESEHIAILKAPQPERTLVQGPGTIYIATFGAVEPANGLVGSPPDSMVWTDLGATLGGVELSIETEWEEIELRQIPDRPMKRLKRRRLSIKTELAEPTLANLGYALNDTPALSAGSGWGAYAPSDRSEGSVLSYNALIVDGWAPGFKAGGQHKRRRLIIRKCLSVDNVQMKYSKDGQSTYTVTWTCHYVSSTIPPFRVIDQEVT